MNKKYLQVGNGNPPPPDGSAKTIPTKTAKKPKKDKLAK